MTTNSFIKITELVLAGAILQGEPAVAGPDPRLHSAMKLDMPSAGVSIAPDGRKFLVIVRLDGSDGPRVVEWKDGKTAPYPSGQWNEWKRGDDPAKGLVRVNAQRIGPDGSLWLVDVGAPGIGDEVLLGGAKLVRIDLASDKVDRIYPLASAVKPKSYLDDVRFNGRHAYITDAGVPGLIVLDLDSGTPRRVLDGDPSTTGKGPVKGEGGRVMTGPDGMPLFIHADQLEVSPDGTWLYYQPCSGGLSRIGTRSLDDAKLGAADLKEHVEPFADTPTTGGTAIDAKGNIYLSDTEKLRVYKITPAGKISTLISDSRLDWADAMWIDASGTLWIPSPQIDRQAPFNNGVSRVQRPFEVYTMPIGEKPPANDHGKDLQLPPNQDGDCFSHSDEAFALADFW